jgi:hypothetical protein
MFKRWVQTLAAPVALVVAPVAEVDVVDAVAAADAVVDASLAWVDPEPW